MNITKTDSSASTPSTPESVSAEGSPWKYSLTPQEEDLLEKLQSIGSNSPLKLTPSPGDRHFTIRQQENLRAQLDSDKLASRVASRRLFCEEEDSEDEGWMGASSSSVARNKSPESKLASKREERLDSEDEESLESNWWEMEGSSSNCTSTSISTTASASTSGATSLQSSPNFKWTPKKTKKVENRLKRRHIDPTCDITIRQKKEVQEAIKELLSHKCPEKQQELFQRILIALGVEFSNTPIGHREAISRLSEFSPWAEELAKAVIGVVKHILPLDHIFGYESGVGGHHIFFPGKFSDCITNPKTGVMVATYVASEKSKQTALFPKSIETEEQLLEFFDSAQLIAARDNRQLFLVEKGEENIVVEGYKSRSGTLKSLFPIFFYEKLERGQKQVNVADLFTVSTEALLETVQNGQVEFKKEDGGAVIDMAKFPELLPERYRALFPYGIYIEVSEEIFFSSYSILNLH